MTDLPEDFEKNTQQQRETDDLLHRNFRPDKGASPLETQPSEQELQDGKKELQRRARFGNKLQGDIGEGTTLRVATDKLGLTPEPRFDQAAHGFDAVYRDDKGYLVVIESKFDERGIKALRGNQMQPEWVDSNARMMQNPGNEQFGVGNAEIGREIQRVGADNVRRMVISIDPSSLEVRAFEGQADRSWKLIGTWNAWDLEQPNL
jgi:hypothetical protein